MKVLVTGNEGFVGQVTSDLIKDKGGEVLGYDLMSGRDVRDVRQLDKYIEEMRPDRILHLAAIARFSEADANPMRAYETNCIGTENVAAMAQKHHLPVVYASTGSVYMPIEQEPPITEDFQVRGNSVYGVTKAIGEYWIQKANPFIILRYAHLYGKEKRHHGLVGGFIDRIQRGLQPQLYGGKQSNDFTYIKDVAEANLLALTAPWDAWNQAYNIGTGEELTAEQAGKLVCEAAGYQGEIKTHQGRTVDPSRFVYNIDKAKHYLGFTPKYDFKAGLIDMFKE